MRKPVIFVLLAACGGIDANGVTNQHETSVDIVNGGFESGDLTGWSTYGGTGGVQQVTSDAHSGSYALRLGAGDHPSGYSGVEQDFTLRAGATLSFWYRAHCLNQASSGVIGLFGTDGQTYGFVSTHDMAQCPADGGWTRVSWYVGAAVGQQVELRLMNVDVTMDPAARGSWLEVDDFEILGDTPPPPAPVVTNGSFDDGLAGWSASGAAVVVDGALKLGSEDPTHDSEAVQTFTVPDGHPSLSFQVQVHCPDTLLYDWVDVMFTDLTAGHTSIVFGPACSSDGAWRPVSFDLSEHAGHRITLSLHTHDDGWAGDGTYALFDEVVVQ
jgi:hypothetical protein